MIDVVMMVYSRPEYFEDSILHLKKQTVDFKLHVISNNPTCHNFFKMIIAKHGMSGSAFILADNSRRTFERLAYTYNHLKDKEYVIFVDDDMLLMEDTVEKLWELREANTMKVFQGKKFFEGDDVLTHEVLEKSNGMFPEFSYGAMNFGIVDTKLITENPFLAQILKDDPQLCYRMDDLVLSWATTQQGGSIVTHGMLPWLNYTDDEKALWRELSASASEAYQKLDAIRPFKRFERIE